ncbi:MAG: LON peptidase substrate-binding domain-containing protein, partial [candidate division KSB1 bacterium]|nr:LON peptidase substrate-binding domain-containing protein [candidate division KSB1 bacterium]
MIDEAQNGNKLIMLVAQKEAENDDPQPDDLYRWGTIATIIKSFKVPDGTLTVMVQGVKRARVLDYTQTEPFFKVMVQAAQEEPVEGLDIDAMAVNLRGLFQ